MNHEDRMVLGLNHQHESGIINRLDELGVLRKAAEEIVVTRLYVEHIASDAGGVELANMIQIVLLAAISWRVW